jgi:multidrug efflux system membrane fusion protein
LRHKGLIITAVLIVAAGTTWYVVSHAEQKKAAAKADAAKANRTIPVVGAKVARRDVPVYLDGLGNVTALKTVTVHTQVDGPLSKVLFTEGQAVKPGDLLALVDTRPFEIQLKQAEGTLQRDQAQLHSAELDFTRYTDLRRQNLIAQQQLDQQTALVGQYEGTVRTDEAAVASAKLNLDYAHIKSPIEGVTGIRIIDPGNLVHQTDANGIVVITQLDPITVIFTLPQDDLVKVLKELAQAHQLPVEAYGRDGDEVIGEGKLALVDNQINLGTATIRLKAIFPNPKRLLWPNGFVKIRLQLQPRKDVLVVPATTVQRGPKGTFAYVVAADGTAESRAIVVDDTSGESTIIKSGLNEGEEVVIDGQNQIRPGSKIKVSEGKPSNKKSAPTQGGDVPAADANTTPADKSPSPKLTQNKPSAKP